MTDYIITISRGYGSGGRTVGKMLSERLGIAYFDRELLRLASEESGISESLFGEADEHVRQSFFKRTGVYHGEVLPPESEEFVSNDNLFNYQAKIIKQLAQNGSCIIVGRCADYILGAEKNVARIYVYSDRETAVKNVMAVDGINEKDAARRIDQIDRYRSRYYRYYTGRDWNNVMNYDLCVNTSGMEFEKCADLLCSYLTVRFG